ncbi:cellulose biosynthesis protein BcsG, partial [Erwinia amylovora]|uniref:cellulose biosynthesis protein BcsG n=1 Tax=Erwinia amylovora TaxID=552 RepID=UPI001CBEA160
DLKLPLHLPLLIFFLLFIYLSLSYLVFCSLHSLLFFEDNLHWQQYTANLPQSAAVSENANAIVLQYEGKPYVQLNGGSWV